MALWKQIVGLILLACAAMVARAQGDVDAPVAKTQSVLKNFACPAGAFPRACTSLQRMVAAGDKDVATQFEPMFLDPGRFTYSVYVVFEKESNDFWIVSSSVSHDGERATLSLVTYGHYANGEKKKLVVAKCEIPASATDPWVFSPLKEGVMVSYFTQGDVAMSSLETGRLDSGDPFSYTIKVMMAPGGALADYNMEIVTGDAKWVHSGKALRFASAGPHK